MIADFCKFAAVFFAFVRETDAVPEWHKRGFFYSCSCVGCAPKAQRAARTLYSGLAYGDGDGVGVAVGSPRAEAPKPVCRAAAAPKPLKIAMPIPNWSNVMGPIDSAM